MLKVSSIAADSVIANIDGTFKFSGNVRVDFAPSEQPVASILEHVPSPPPEEESREVRSTVDLSSSERPDEESDAESDADEESDVARVDHLLDDYVFMDHWAWSWDHADEWSWSRADEKLRQDIIIQRTQLCHQGLPYPESWCYV